jgi:hypothetical protein
MRRSVHGSLLVAALLLLTMGSFLTPAPASGAGDPPRPRIAPTIPAVAAQRAAAPTARTAPSPVHNMTYHGGPIMQAVTAYTIYWMPNSLIPVAYQNLLNRYFTDVGGSSYYNILYQYFQLTPPTGIFNQSTFGGAFVDTTNSYGGKGSTTTPLLDTDIQAEVLRAITANPGWNPPGLTTQYFVFTEPNVESCFDSTKTSCTPGISSPSGYCAYHNDFLRSGSSVIYANMPFANTWPSSCVGITQSPNGNIAADAEISLAAHEHFESTSDPLFSPPAWFDSDFSGEISDKCNFRFGTLQPDGSNVVLNGNKYVVQQQWSNGKNDGVTPFSGCVLFFLRGDINEDAIVDIRDYGLWRQAFGVNTCGNLADLNGDCVVDIQDYGIWRQNFGHTGP